MGNIRIYIRHDRVINERISGWQSKSNNKSNKKVKVMLNLLLANKEVKP
jgi:predicted membrane protein